MKGRYRRGGLLIALLIFLVSQSACSRLEIEERAFPLALWVAPAEQEGLYDFYFFFEEDDGEGSYTGNYTLAKAENYKKVYELYVKIGSGELDDTHMQAIILDEKIMQDENFLCDFFETFQTEQHFSWNTVLYLTEHTPEPETLEEDTDGRPGTYLKDVAEHAAERGEPSPTLGDLFIEWNNQEGNLQIPLLEENVLVVDY